MTTRKMFLSAILAGVVAGAALGAAMSARGETPSLPSAATYGAAIGAYPMSSMKGCDISCTSAAGGVVITCGLAGRRSVTISNVDDTMVRVCDSGQQTCSSSVGYQLVPGKDLVLNTDPGAAVPVVLKCSRSGSASKTVSVLEAN